MKTKTLYAEVFLKGRKGGRRGVDFGIGKGVIAKFKVDFKDGGYGFNSPLFAMAVVDKEARIVKSVVGVEWTEGENKKGKK